MRVVSRSRAEHWPQTLFWYLPSITDASGEEKIKHRYAEVLLTTSEVSISEETVDPATPLNTARLKPYRLTPF